MLNKKFIKSNQWLLCLLVLTLVLKVVIFFKTSVISADGPYFISQVESFQAGRWLEALQMNRYIFLYPFMVYCLSGVFPDAIFAGKLLSLIFSVASVVPLYLLVRELGNQRAALFSVAIFAAAPGLNLYSVSVMREPGYLFFLLLAMLFTCWAIKSRQRKWYFWSAVVVLISALFRMEGMLWGAAFILILCASCFGERRQQVDGRWNFLVFLGVFVLPLLSALFLAYQMGIIGNGFLNLNLYLGKVFSGNPFAINPQLKSELKDLSLVLPNGFNANDFGEIAYKNIRLIYFVGLLKQLSKVVFWPFFYVGFLWFFISLKVKEKLNFTLVIFAILNISVCMCFLLRFNFLDVRYTFSLIVVFIVFSGIGLDQLLSGIKKQSIKNAFTPLIVVLISLSLYFSIAEIKGQYVSSKEAGMWIASHSEYKSYKFISNSIITPFYSGRLHSYSQFNIHKYIKSKNYRRRIVNQKDTILAITVEKNELKSIEDIYVIDVVGKFEDKRFVTIVMAN